MNMDTYRKATNILEEIEKVEQKMEKIKSLGANPKDEDYTFCRQTAYDALDVILNHWKKEFEKI